MVQYYRRPVSASYADAILKGLGAASQFMSLRDRMETSERADREATEAANRRSRTENLALRALGGAPIMGGTSSAPGSVTSQLGAAPTTTPGNVRPNAQALRQLTALDPTRGAQVRDVLDANQERFNRERAFLAAEIQELPVDEQLARLKKRVAMVQNRGGDPSNTQGLVQLLESEDPEQVERGRFFIREAVRTGERQGYLRPQAVRKGPAPTSLERNIAAIAEPGTPEYKKLLKEAILKPQTRIELGSERKEIAKREADEYADVLSKGRLAADNLENLEILEQIDLTTGRLEPAKQAFAAWGQALGVDTSGIADVTKGEAFTAKAREIVLSNQMKLKGQTSDRDMKIVEDTAVKLGNTTEGNRFIMRSAKASALRATQRRDFILRQMEDGSSYRKAAIAWEDFLRETPFVSPTKKTTAGLPVFYYQFRDEMRRQNPQGVSEDEIIDGWRQYNAN